MPGYLIAEEGALSGLTIHLQDDQEWILGRDPDVCFQVLEDPMVSRKHVLIRLEDGNYIIENLSATNPASINGETLEEPYTLSDQDFVRIGSTVFRFTTSLPSNEPLPTQSKLKSPLDENEFDELLSFKAPEQTRWLLKVTMGPNTGAEISLDEGKQYVIGKDQNCSIIFQDLSVSRQHAKLSIAVDGSIEIEDLGSKNGVLVNGSLIDGPTSLASQDVVAIGTTTFVIIDRLQERETLYAPIIESSESLKLAEKEAEQKEAELHQELAAKKNWKETFIPNRHLAIAGALLLIIGSSFVGIISLFHEAPIQVAKIDYDRELDNILHNYPAVTYNFEPTSGNLFLVGHVMTDVSYQEMQYLLKSLSFIKTIDDNVIIDEYVWQNMNALLFKNPDFRSVLISGAEPGRFVLRGYVQSPDQLVSLVDYVNMNFPYLDRLSNTVVVEDNLNTKIQSQLIQRGYNNVSFQLTNGEVVFSGRLDESEQKEFNSFLKDVGKNPGVRQVKNFVIMVHETSSRIDLSGRYTVTGTSKFGDTNQFVLINGRILSVGDVLDGMNITQINPKSIILDKDGMKYKIDYNLQ
jgi:type III secretion system YscD/HrpQ family protein